MKIDHYINTDVLVIGGGVAATRAALSSAQNGAKTTMVIKKELGKSGSTNWPRKGMYGSAWQAADGCGGDSDSPEVHYKDIMNSALGMADAKLAKILSEESPERLRELEYWGFNLVKDPENKKPHYSGYSCFASQPRAHGMLANTKGGHTGNLIEVMSNKLTNYDCEIHENITIIDLIVNDNQCSGAIGINKDGDYIKYKCGSVIIGTGGAAQIFPLSSTPGDITGDGYAMAFRAGASLANLEFMQYMVKTIYSRSKNLQTLVDSQVGGTFWTLNPKLIDINGKNILEKILPENINESESFEMRTNHYPFSSRDSSKWIDISIQRCIRSGNASEKGGVIVDFSEIDFKNIKQSKPQHSPTKSVATTLLGDDENKQIDVTHSAHAVNGGIVVDEWGSTEIDGLFAVGETIAGPHGADRLGGGMISQSCVYGKRTGEKAASYSSEINLRNDNHEEIQIRLEKFNNSNGPSYNTIRKELKTLAKDHLIVERNGTGLNFFDNRINELINEEITNAPFSGNIRLIKNLETENLLTVARLMVKSAKMRKESRGSHCRLDYQNIDNKSWNKSIFWNLENGKLKYKLKQYRQDPNNVKQLS